jgi:hypothetical protein
MIELLLSCLGLVCPRFYFKAFRGQPAKEVPTDFNHCLAANTTLAKPVDQIAAPDGSYPCAKTNRLAPVACDNGMPYRLIAIRAKSAA